MNRLARLQPKVMPRTTGGLGVINVTSGPGGINALNGVFGAWTDSIPMLILSGQVKRETCMATYKIPGMRQLGYQEADIISMVKGITKYAVLVEDPESVRYHLERAVYLATTGRPGPCWLDFPVDVQGAKIDETALKPYDPSEDQPKWNLERLPTQCREILDRIRTAARPVILGGSGVRSAHSVEIFDTVIRKLGIPVTTSRTAVDLIPSDHPLHCGRPGMDNGNRPGNFTVQNSDLLLVVGCRLNIVQVGYNWKTFARAAFKVQVDADEIELDKPTVKPDYPIHCDARLFLEELNRQIDADGYQTGRHDDWLKWCRERVARYPVVQPRHRDSQKPLNPYHFIDVLIRKLSDDDLIVCGNGSAFVVASQVAQLRKCQRFFFNSGCASMGHDLPAAIGAAAARGDKRVICLAGDGSIQMNIQELQTVAHYHLPIKIFVLNNGGYLSIRTTQRNFFKFMVGESPASGVSFPDYVKVAEAYGIPTRRIASEGFQTALDELLALPGPMLVEVSLGPRTGV